MRLGAFLGLAILASAAPANAGVFTDDLSRCLVNKSSDSDQQKLMQWMFAAFALNPSLSPLTKITTAQRSEFTKGAADVYTRLLVVDCRAEAVAALKNEGDSSLGPAFGVLGRTTASRIFNAPAVGAELEKLGESFDKDALKKLFADAGIDMKDK